MRRLISLRGSCLQPPPKIVSKSLCFLPSLSHHLILQKLDVCLPAFLICDCLRYPGP